MKIGDVHCFFFAYFIGYCLGVTSTKKIVPLWIMCCDTPAKLTRSSLAIAISSAAGYVTGLA